MFFLSCASCGFASRWPREVPKLAPGRGEKVEKREVLFDLFRIQAYFWGLIQHHKDKISSKITIQCYSPSLVIQVEDPKA